MNIRRVRSNIDNVDLLSKQVPYVPIHASFDVADTDLLKLLIGPLYGENAAIGIRELMQNAVDAVIELREFKKQFQYEFSETPVQREDVAISIDQNESGERWLTISDRGIGMTINIVKEYFLKAGSSLRRSEIWKKTFEDTDGKSKILRSGRFGIGALAAFLVGDEIHVRTCHISDRNGGIEFNAQIDTDSIEIKHINRPVGTTIRIKMKQSAIEELIPLITESKWDAKEKIDKWDWFCLEDPLISRRINELNYEQRLFLPKLKSKLPLGWHRVNYPELEDIQWTYLYYVPDLVCNGIVVRPERNRSLSVMDLRDKFIEFSVPKLSIFDFNANFPLNIQRTDITTPNLPFHESLLASVIRDFITFILLEAPTNRSPSETVNELYFKPRYYANVGDAAAQRYYREINIPFWISTDEGTGIFCDPVLFKDLGKKSTLVIFNYNNQSSTPKINLNENIAALWIPLSKSQGWASGLINSFATGLGFSLSRFAYDEFFSMKLRPYGHTINSARVLISKRAIEAFDSLRRYSAIEYDIIRDINNITLTVFNEAELNTLKYSDLKKRMFENTVDVLKEWEDENWIIFSIGECPAPEFNFEEFAKANTTPDINYWPSIIAEWYFENHITAIENSLFSSLWNNLIRQPVIPYDLTERKRKLNHAFQELQEDIENYKATKELIENELRRRREEEG